MLLLIVWLVAAGFATAGKIFDAPTDLPVKRVRRRPAVAGAVRDPRAAVPTAVGRWLFGPDLRDVAASLQQNEVAFRLGALWTPSTLMFYLCGLAVGVAVWVAYHCWPVRQASIRPVVALVRSRCCCDRRCSAGRPRSSAGQRAETLVDGQSGPERCTSPAAPGCYQPPADQPAGPEETAVISGFSCQTLTTYVGYRQMVSHTLPAGLARWRPGSRTAGRSRPRRWPRSTAPVIVIAGTDRLSGEADQLFAVAVYRAEAAVELAVRRGPQSPDGAPLRPGAGRGRPGRGTRDPGEKRATVVVRCEDRTVRFDPITGRR